MNTAALLLRRRSTQTWLLSTRGKTATESAKGNRGSAQNFVEQRGHAAEKDIKTPGTKVAVGMGLLAAMVPTVVSVLPSKRDKRGGGGEMICIIVERDSSWHAVGCSGSGCTCEAQKSDGCNCGCGLL
mmetsp:Transcript_49078/g.98745  ORF Transcript_49078/g.98745 Transcript_49078/m.98745 type:complete len:128 (+) Transcript_49078:1768-2151(+)